MASLTLLMAATIVLAADQGTKALVRTRLRERQAISFGGVTIRRVLNRRFSERRPRSPHILLALWLAELALLLLIVELAPGFDHRLVGLGAGAAFGGATGNLVDHYRDGGVVDFIDVGWWPVFNLADAAIVLGAFAVATPFL